MMILYKTRSTARKFASRNRNMKVVDLGSSKPVRWGVSFKVASKKF